MRAFKADENDQTLVLESLARRSWRRELLRQAQLILPNK